MGGVWGGFDNASSGERRGRGLWEGYSIAPWGKRGGCGEATALLHGECGEAAPLLPEGACPARCDLLCRLVGEARVTPVTGFLLALNWTLLQVVVWTRDGASGVS